MQEIFDYYPGMDRIQSTIKDQVLAKIKDFKNIVVTEEDVQMTLSKDKLDERDFFNLLSSPAEKYLEEMGELAKNKKNKYFGNNINIFSPLYISNYCSNSCRYCGFNSTSGIKRNKLALEEIEIEMQSLASEGIEEVLILTGESDKHSDPDYIVSAIELAKKYFRLIGLEIYPTTVDNYKRFHQAGADFVTVFQETYNPEKYSYYHPRGNKRSMVYRLEAQERAILGGMRGVGFGSLFGLSDPITDAFLLGYHASLIQKKYPHAEIAISLPRIRPSKGIDRKKFDLIDEKKLFQIMLATRIYLPFVSITISTRERKEFRNLAMVYGANKISASVYTGIGNRNKDEVTSEEDDQQFEISDPRTEKEIEKDLKKLGLTPVLTDYLYL